MAKRPRRRAARPNVVLRWAALAGLVLIAFLYYQPVRSYFEARESLERRAAEVRALEREQRALERRLAASSSDAAIGRVARRLGFVRPGERLVIVKGIAGWRRADRRRASIATDG